MEATQTILPLFHFFTYSQSLSMCPSSFLSPNHEIHSKWNWQICFYQNHLNNFQCHCYTLMQFAFLLMIKLMYSKPSLKLSLLVIGNRYYIVNVNANNRSLSAFTDNSLMTLVILINIDSPYTGVVTESMVYVVSDNIITYCSHVHRSALYFIIITTADSLGIMVDTQVHSLWPQTQAGVCLILWSKISELKARPGTVRMEGSLHLQEGVRLDLLRSGMLEPQGHPLVILPQRTVRCQQ